METGSGDNSGAQLPFEGVKRRNPAVPKAISEISPSSDRRVRLSGKIAKKGANGAITLSDGTGSVEVFFDNLDLVDDIEKDYKALEQVIVTGLVVPSGAEKFDLTGETIFKQEGRLAPEELIKRAEKALKGQ